MKIFLDTADIEEIRIAARWGVLDGVTTNPTLYGKVGGSYEDILKEICRLTSGPVSAEVVAEDVEGMLREGRAFAKLARNIVVKVPMSEEGLEAISRFAEEGIQTNCTLIFSTNQGFLAAKAGASLISPFVGRLDDINEDGMTCVRELAELFAIHEIDSQVLAASIRHPLHVTQAALAGAHIATLPFKVLQQMVHHPLTDKGIVTFREDWEKARVAAAAKVAEAGATSSVAGTGTRAASATPPTATEPTDGRRARNGAKAPKGVKGAAKSGAAAKSSAAAGKASGSPTAAKSGGDRPRSAGSGPKASAADASSPKASAPPKVGAGGGTGGTSSKASSAGAPARGGSAGVARASGSGGAAKAGSSGAKRRR
jgi:transaldolase